jgi:eukaryotic-like serine/threonine-protein kinase
MDDQNNFLNSYKKKLNEEKPETLSEAEQTPSTRHYEEKTAFVPIQPVQPLQPPGGRRGVRLMPVIIIGFIIVALAAVLIWYFSRGVTAIDLTGYKLSDAQIWANENGINLQINKEYNDEFEVDEIIAQEPVAGDQLDRGGFLKIRVSLGHDLNVLLDLPDLLMMTMSQVEDWAATNYMSKVRITTEFNKEVAAGKVIRFEINDNTVVDRVKRNTPIYIIVSKGPEPLMTEPVTIPDFRSMTVDQSQEFADENDLVLFIAEDYDDTVPKGSIIRQSVAADQKVNPGSEITLTVSLGRKIVVPNFSGISKERASAVASELGITLILKDKYSSRNKDAFISQNIAANSIYMPGTILEVAYSLGNKLLVMNYVGQSRSGLDLWVQEVNGQGAQVKIGVTYTQNNAPKDTILYQDKANTNINIDATIYITVSRGPKVFVPDLVAPAGSNYDVAFTRDEAAAACEAVGLIVIFVEEAQSNRLPGEVWHQSVAAGTEVYQGTTITLKYAPVNATLDLPNFVGMTRQAIIDAGWLKKLDITFVDAGYIVEGYAGQIYEQSLPAGRTYAYGTKITLQESQPAPTPEPSPTPEPTSSEE